MDEITTRTKGGYIILQQMQNWLFLSWLYVCERIGSKNIMALGNL